MSARHLLIALTAHGFGHAAQTAEIVNALRTQDPALRLTLWTPLPHAFLASRFRGDFELVPRETDVGMCMASAIDVLAEETARAYAAFHRHWECDVDAEARALERLAPDLVLANVPYRVLAAAARVGVPALAMSSLNWADIYWHYCRRSDRGEGRGAGMHRLRLHRRPEARPIHDQILAAYNSAAAFIQMEPSMPMADLSNRRAIGPCGRVGRDRRGELNERLGLSPDTRLVLVAPGGMELRAPIESWPAMPGLQFVVPASWRVHAENVSSIETLGLPFTDILRSSDAVIGKPGYGTFVEAACNATPMLYVPRGDWPEAPHLIEWLARNSLCREISQDALWTGRFGSGLEWLWAQPGRGPVAPTGIAQAAGLLAKRLGATAAEDVA